MNIQVDKWGVYMRQYKRPFLQLNRPIAAIGTCAPERVNLIWTVISELMYFSWLPRRLELEN